MEVFQKKIKQKFIEKNIISKCKSFSQTGIAF